MPVHAPVTLLVLLATSLAALSAANPTLSKRFEDAPWAPATKEQGPFDQCSTEQHHADDAQTHAAAVADCLAIRAWATANNGEWILKATTDPNDPNDWHALHTHGSCVLVVKNTQPTSVGNKDVADFIATLRAETGPVEELGVFGGCQAGADVNFWLRNSGP
jgi:hypothetical protein